ncbi:hypothetical protein [Peribacillus simplex]|uniref:hypothetical protein n=1 Tax=Peribacillus simplex TaxID=1478 RepID=UPI003D2E1F37
MNGGPPPAGTPVFFTIDPALGTVTPASTDASGFYMATFTVTTATPGTVMSTAAALGIDSNTVIIDIENCIG